MRVRDGKATQAGGMYAGKATAKAKRSGVKSACVSGDAKAGLRRAEGEVPDSRRKDLALSAAVFAFFAIWTVIVDSVDVRSVGPNGSEVGLAAVNAAFHELTGVNLALYELTDWLSLIPIACMAAFGLLGLVQLVTRRSLMLVDGDLLVLGGFYVVLLAAYVGFDVLALNYRPALIEGVLEPSYPSSTTLLVLGVSCTTIMQVNRRVEHAGVRRATCVVLAFFAAFMVVARLLSGVHWLTDIIGGILLAASLVLAYRSAVWRYAQKRPIPFTLMGVKSEISPRNCE